MQGATDTPRPPQWRRWAKRGLIALLSLLLLGAISLAVLQFTALPNFALQPFRQRAESAGYRLHVERVEWRGLRTLTLFDLTLAPIDTPANPTIELESARLRLQWPRSGPPSVARKIELGGGVLRWTNSNSNEPDLEIPAMEAELAGDTLSIRTDNARAHGLAIEINGQISHFSHALKWRLAETPDKQPAEWINRLRTELESLQFDPDSSLQIRARVDARTEQFTGAVELASPGVMNALGSIDGAGLTAGIEPEGDGKHRVTFQFHASNAAAAGVEAADVRAQFHSAIDLASPSDASGTLAASMDLQLPMARLTGLQLSITPTNASPSPQSSAHGLPDLAVAARVTQLSGAGFEASHLQWNGSIYPNSMAGRRASGAFSSEEISTKLASLTRLSGKLDIEENPKPSFTPAPEFAYWNPFLPLMARFNLDASGIERGNVFVDQITLEGSWTAPLLELSSVSGRLDGKTLHASGSLNMTNRVMTARGDLDMDAHKISGLLTPSAQRWLRQFTWETPPEVSGAVSLTMPPWSDPTPNWRRETLPSVTLEGQFSGGAGSFRNTQLSGASSHFTLTNLVWRLPDLTARRPEGVSYLNYSWDMRDQSYYWQIDATLVPTALRPMIPDPYGIPLDDFTFDAPARAQGEIWGRWMRPESVGFTGTLVARDFTYRSQPIDFLKARSINYTNFTLTIADGAARRGQQLINLHHGRYDMKQSEITVTNGFTSFDPLVLARWIGTNAVKALSDFRFDGPVSALVNGRIPTRSAVEADLRVDAQVADFSYWRFRTPRGAGKVHWKGRQLAFTGVEAGFHEGHLDWQGIFDFGVTNGASFSFSGDFRGAKLSPLVHDITDQPTHLEGRLSGHVSVTRALTHDPKSWNGFGHAVVEDGYLWDVPLFGVLSPMLNRVAPGLGASRISDGSGDFRIENSVVSTRNLELVAPALRLQYQGQVDLAGNVDALVQAEILRDAWVFGRFVSLALWPLSKVLKVEISGTVGRPKSQLIYIPKAFLIPFHPARAVKDTLKPEDASEPESGADPSPNWWPSQRPGNGP